MMIFIYVHIVAAMLGCFILTLAARIWLDPPDFTVCEWIPEEYSRALIKNWRTGREFFNWWINSGKG